MKKNLFIPVVILLSFLFFSCKKESFINSPDARLYFSADSIKFDTVFTTVGSITQSFKIFNDNDQKLRLSKVKLMGGNGSPYKINVNGIPSGEVDNIEVAANDSIYIFVTVTVNPTAANLPFVISDSVLVSYNGNNRFVQLQAYGQNAHFLRDEIITNNTTWSNDLPYVILGSLQVDTNITLTINEGCRIYSHANAPFIVDGTLVSHGVKNNEVQFTGDRLDDPYKYLPASWPGIYFRNTSKNNDLSYTNIKNAYQAIMVQNPASNSNPKLSMHQCIIDNAYDAGILTVNSSIDADNTLISNCGRNIFITLGGDYTFTNCTVAAYSNIYLLHKLPVLFASNAADQNGTTITADINAVFRNCIFWADNGITDNEVVTDKQGSNTFNVTFDHCLYKATDDPANCILNSVIRNQDPVFDSIDITHNYYDFRTSLNPAPGVDQGAAIAFPKDLDDNNRSVGAPDLGAYEKQ